MLLSMTRILPDTIPMLISYDGAPLDEKGKWQYKTDILHQRRRGTGLYRR